MGIVWTQIIQIDKVLFRPFLSDDTSNSLHTSRLQNFENDVMSIRKFSEECLKH